MSLKFLANLMPKCIALICFLEGDTTPFDHLLFQ